MVTLIQAFCKSGKSSLRRKISNDKALETFGFSVNEHKNNSRPDGWLKISSHDANGTLNIQWDSNTNVLSARVINKANGKPDKITGQFISYLMGQHDKVIKAIHIIKID